jgi:hypothetical protein
MGWCGPCVRGNQRGQQAGLQGNDGDLGGLVLDCAVRKKEMEAGRLGLHVGKGRADRAGLARRKFENSGHGWYKMQINLNSNQI